MATITKQTSKRTGQVTYKVQIRMTGRPTVTQSFKRKKDAEDWARETEAQLRLPLSAAPPEVTQHTVRELIDRYIDRVLPTKRSARSPGQQLLWWRDKMGHLPLQAVTPARLTEYKEELLRTPGPHGKRRSPATVVRYLAALSHVFTMAVKEWQWMDDNPLLKIRKPKEPRGRVRFLDAEERANLLEACQESSNRLLYPIVILALSTGMRQGEILGLKWGDVDLESGRAVLHQTKNDERRGVPLVGAALAALQSLADARRSNNRKDLVFPSPKNPAKPIDITRPWRDAMEEAGIDDFRFHDLRHSAASYLAMSGASLTEIAAVLGHKTLSMVKRYAHLSEAHTAGVVARMNEKFLK